jgi:hypothetical protein
MGVQYPQLWTKGQTYDGSMWQVGVVTWNGGDDPTKACDITPTNATNYAYDGTGNWHDVSDGSNNYCVNNGPTNMDGSSFTPTEPTKISWPFKTDGSVPASAAELCPYLAKCRSESRRARCPLSRGAGPRCFVILSYRLVHA